HVDCLDVENLSREALAGARAWRDGDRPTATNRLRAAFELLTQARERFYPVDAYILDLCLLAPGLPASALDAALEARAAFTMLAQADAIAAWEAAAPQALQAIRAAVDAGWADVVGGAYAEVDEPLLPVESILWQFRRAAEVYRDHLGGRTVETLGRRRFGLYPQLVQVARRCGFRFALHLGFDAGKFPVLPEAKRLWRGPDGSSLETLLRPPLAADRPAGGVQLPWRLARTLKDDHVATLPLVHWPSPVAGWYLDLRRVAAYSPVLARWSTLNDYFHLTDRPYEAFEPELDEYVFPYLDQDVARGDSAPISRRARHARLRARFDALTWLRSLAALLSVAPAPDREGPSAAAVEEAIEAGRPDEAGATLDRQEPAWAAAVARAVAGDAAGGRPGYLVLNPLGVARRAAVLLPEAAADLRPEGPLRAAQLTEEGVWAVVDLPAFGYAWVPRATPPDAPPAPPGVLSARDRTLRNEAIEVEIDEKTGGLRAVRAAGETVARLGQQLVIAGLIGADGSAATSRMRGEGVEVEYGGPALVQAVTRGTLRHPADDRVLAAFRQRVRLWSGRPILDLEIVLEDLDPSWLASIAPGPAWERFLSCRWAWPDPAAELRRLSLLGPVPTTAERPETPDALDIATRRQRTALLFGGLAHHRRHGPRMLDTLLVAGREAARSFTLGVALDLEHPHQAAQDLIAPPLVVPTAAGAPRPGPAGWFFQLDHRAVAVTRVAYVDPSGGGRGWGLAFHLRET
ncbi:MAG TPA: glycosyl hydrolase family 38, partial [Isosphaeraceae bacterium]